MGRAGGEYQEGGRTLRAELPRKGSREPPRVNLAVGNRNHVKSSQASQTFPARVSALARWQLERPRAKQQSNQLIARICAGAGRTGFTSGGKDSPVATGTLWSPTPPAGAQSEEHRREGGAGTQISPGATRQQTSPPGRKAAVCLAGGVLLDLSTAQIGRSQEVQG